MRIAISGTHRAGKSTLVEALAARLTDHTSVAEPYEQLLEDGYEFLDPPSLEDFEAQLERSLDLLEESRANVIFDRCPIDFIGYLSVHEDGAAFAVQDWLPRVRRAVATLDLVVLVPIEEPDRIALAPSDRDDASREAVDGELKALLRDDALQIGARVLEVKGPAEARADMVLQWLAGAP